MQTHTLSVEIRMALLDNPIQLIVVLFCLSLLPLFAVMGTSFLKLSIVFRCCEMRWESADPTQYGNIWFSLI